MSPVVQRVYLSIGEKGTEAAAATGVSIIARSGRVAHGPRVVLDHPFLIRDTQTGAILIASQVQNPTS